MRLIGSFRCVVICIVCAPFTLGCDTPQTSVIFENDYPPSAPAPLVIYRGFWQAVALPAPVPPGASSQPQPTVAASPNPAYVVLAPGWDPTGAAAPTSLVVLQSRSGFALHFDSTLRIPVADSTFVGNCASGSFLSQDQADFIRQRVFANDFAGLGYDAATCSTTGGPP